MVFNSTETFNGEEVHSFRSHWKCYLCSCRLGSRLFHHEAQKKVEEPGPGPVMTVDRPLWFMAENEQVMALAAVAKGLRTS
jgi:hypothetical protein